MQSKRENLAYRPRKRANIKAFKDAKDAYLRAAARYPHPKAQERIEKRVNFVDCVRDAVRKSGVATEDAAEQLWRIASGYAHGRRWAPFTAGLYVLDHELEDAKVYRGMVDMKTVSRLVLLITSMIQYAEWLYATRAGYDCAKPELVAQARRPAKGQ